jgi:ubiquinone/menaquinone biosynthesis C-methylase UbiE
MNNSEFYNSLSSDYDEMINFENSLKNKIESLKNFISPNYKTALDLGCGTGVDSIALYKLGLSVDAVDHSQGMLEIAAKNADKHESKINFIQSGLGELNLENKSYDFIVSLGNTIANIDNDELNKLLANLNKHLNKSGTILIQLINYAKLPTEGEYILNKFKNENISIIRKYEILSRFINFIIHKTDNSTDKETEIVTKLFPHSSKFFKTYAKNNGYNIELYGSLKREDYINDQSQNLVIVLNK